MYLEKKNVWISYSCFSSWCQRRRRVNWGQNPVWASQAQCCHGKDYSFLQIPLFLFPHLDGKLFSSANEWTQVRVGKNILSHLKETVKVNRSHLLFTVWKVTHGIAMGESLSKRTNHSIFPFGVTHFFCLERKPRKKMFLSLILISRPGNRERCWNTRQLNQWERKCWCYQSDLPWGICCNMNAA